MAAADDQIFERTVERVTKLMLGVAVAGSLVALAWKGLPSGAGFLVGSTASWLNFRWLSRFVAALGPEPKGRVAPIFAIRYILFALGGYVILKYSKLSLPATLAGLFVSLAAVIIEVIIQLTYERRNLDH